MTNQPQYGPGTYGQQDGAAYGTYPAPLPQQQPPYPQYADEPPADPARQRPDAAQTPTPRASRNASPIIKPGLRPALGTAVLGALLAVAAPLGDLPLALGVLLLQAVTAAGWFRLNGMWPARQGIALAFLSGLVADIGLLTVDREQAPTVIIGTLGVWCTLTVVLHLRNRSEPDERLYALTAALTSTALTVLAAGYLVAPAATGADPVTVGAAAVTVAVLVRALPLPAFVSPAVALLASAGGGFAAGQFTELGTAGALMGAAAGACALTGLRVASYDFPSRFVHMTAGVALPLTLAAPVVHLLGRAIG